MVMAFHTRMAGEADFARMTLWLNGKNKFSWIHLNSIARKWRVKNEEATRE